MKTQTQNSKLTLADILAKKVAKEQQSERTEAVYVHSMNGDITLHAVPKEIIYRAMDDLGKDESARNRMRVNARLVYNSIKELQTKEFYGDQDPAAVTEAVFEPYEIAEMSDTVMRISGFAKPEEDIKN